jgi:hypothetical protein
MTTSRSADRRTLSRVVASRTTRITAASGDLRVDRARRTIFGTLFRYGEAGHTSAGVLAVDTPGAIELPADFGDVELTREHEPDVVRGHLAMWDDNGERVYVAMRVVDGPEGDAALDEAESRKRGGLSWDIVAELVEPPADDVRGLDGIVVRGQLRRIGQVRDPAFNSARIDRVVASSQAATAETNRREHTIMTAEQRARLAELIALQNLTAEQRAELDELTALAVAEAAQPDEPPADEPPADQPATPPADQPATAVAAARRQPAVPAGVPRRQGRGAARQGSAWAEFCETVTASLRPGGGGLQAITAAFSDVTNTANPGTEAPAWSGELWSGLQYEPEWTPLLASGDLTSWEGSGWRWTTKPAMQDYAGDKAAVPSNVLATEPGGYEAARMAVGHDIDRKFYDFPGGAAFLQSYGEAAREDWAVKLDAKVRAYILANAVAYGAATTTMLKAAALALFGVKSNTKARGTFVAVNDSDFLDLLDINADAIPAFLEMFNVKPGEFIYDPNVPAGTVVAGVKQAATVRTLPGSPIRVDAQHLANGGVDSAFFGYWAIEEHHESGIVTTTWA